MSEKIVNKKRKRFINKKVVVILLLIVIGAYILVNKYAGLISELNYGAQKSKPLSINVEELSHNVGYAGVGQKEVKGMDGYDTTFTAVDGKVYKEYKQVGNASYKNNEYWDGTFEENGCGLAAIATLLSGYGYDYTPEDLRKIYVNFEGEHLEGDQMSSELTNRFEIANTDFLYASLYFEKEYVMEQLSKNKPILICVWNTPDSTWTTSSHYMLLLATDNQNKVYVSNPNGLYGKIKMSGWYDTESILPYIAKAMYIEE